MISQGPSAGDLALAGLVGVHRRLEEDRLEFAEWEPALPIAKRRDISEHRQRQIPVPARRSAGAAHRLRGGLARRPAARSRYDNFGLRKTYSAAILPSRTTITSSPVY